DAADDRPAHRLGPVADQNRQREVVGDEEDAGRDHEAALGVDERPDLGRPLENGPIGRRRWHGWRLVYIDHASYRLPVASCQLPVASGSRFSVLRSPFSVFGFRFSALGPRSSVLGPRSSVLGPRLVDGCRHPPPMDVGYLHPMAKRARYQNRIELLQGPLDLLILQTLQWGPQHGYGIAQAIQAGSSDVLQVDTGSLYPALHRLEKQKWIAATWKLSENKQRTRVYRLTAAGRRQLA